mgnify:CR=1 FL=1
MTVRAEPGHVLDPELLVELTGAEDAIAVNNNASAVFLALCALARGRSVLVSRGELVAIGGSFKIPEILESSGAVLAEVEGASDEALADAIRESGAHPAVTFEEAAQIATELSIGSVTTDGSTYDGIVPFTTARVKPSFTICSICLRYSPFLPRTYGARIVNFVPAGSVSSGARPSVA